ncbi:hypothetical protein [Sporosarcina koreensis]|uniref:hypothetical protein n=1 Tax=Sporosarcina koreensis TaxID=334735 RepID=UPI00075F00F3|nr:hypothetical protein [Sporosarcina koreensis]
MHKHQDAIDEYLAKRKDRIQTSRENKMLREENARLREALEIIRKDTYWEDEDIVSVRHVIRKRAEKALAGETNGQHQV